MQKIMISAAIILLSSFSFAREFPTTKDQMSFNCPVEIKGAKYTLEISSVIGEANRKIDGQKVKTVFVQILDGNFEELYGDSFALIENNSGSNNTLELENMTNKNSGYIGIEISNDSAKAVAFIAKLNEQSKEYEVLIGEEQDLTCKVQ